MWTIASDMIEEAKRQGRAASSLAPDEAVRIRQTASKICGVTGEHWPLWELMNGPSFREEHAWRRIVSFIGASSCILFWEPRTEREALRFQSGTDLVAVLEESHRSEFYVTNDNVSWLIAYNDHDYLIGVGEAADWIAQHVGAGSHIDACDSRRSS